MEHDLIKEIDVLVQITTSSGLQCSTLEEHELKDGYEIILTTKRIGGRIYAKARKRKIDANNGC